MTDGEIDDRDKAVFEAVGGDAEELSPSSNGTADHTDDAGDTVEVPKDEWTAMQERLARLEQRVTQLEGQGAPGIRDSMSTLQKYSKLVEDGQGDTIGVTDRRAVAIYQNWSELSEHLPAGVYGVSTRRNSRKKNAPSQLRLDLENLLGESLEWEQIYRTIQKVAELSGGEPERDRYDRLHITGGLFEYHEKTTPDGENTYKVLIEP